MEVRGGNGRAEEMLEMAGLRTWIWCRPHQGAEGGGDVYYFSSCASGRISRMLLADVSGHGQAVSDTATGLRDLMRRNINFIRQERLFREMNRRFSEREGHSGFATAVVWTFFQPTRILQLSSAGHPCPLLFRKSENHWLALEQESLEGKDPADIPLGLFHQARFSELEVRLQTGDLILCYSDALVEAVDAQGNLLGIDGLKSAVSRLDPDCPQELIPGLLEQVGSLRSGNLNRDDVTLLLSQVTRSGIPLKDSLLSPLRILAGFRDRTRIFS